MPNLASIPCARRTDLIVRRTGDRGESVVKDPQTGGYFGFGAQETFLLEQLDGKTSAQMICRLFTQRFGEEIALTDLEEFVEQAGKLGLLRAGEAPPKTETPAAAPRDSFATNATRQEESQSVPNTPTAQRQQSILYWRLPLLDPDRFLGGVLPWLNLVFTPAFVTMVIVLAAAAGAVLWQERAALVSRFTQAYSPSTLLVAWAIVATVTLLHELSHGLACKRFGGNVHEVGFLLMFFMPCFYCNVSDAWLIKEKSRRLWVTAAGPVCDLLLWALAVFIWRLTIQDSLINYLAWIALSVLGVRLILNCNPLMKLDGYYALSDVLEIPNLQTRAYERVRGHVRRFLWGTPGPGVERWPKLLCLYGIASQCYSTGILLLLTAFVGQMLWTKVGTFGLVAASPLGFLLLRRTFRGLGPGGDVRMWKMLQRTALFTVVLAAIIGALVFLEIDDTVAGPVLIRATNRAEVRASAAGFLREVFVTETSSVQAGTLIAQLEVPDLNDRIARKRAEVEEAKAKLRLLVAGPRPEDEKEALNRVKRAEEWVVLAKSDLKQRQQVLAAELSELEQKIRQYELEVQYAAKNYEHVASLLEKGAISQREYDENQRKLRVFQTQLEQTRAQLAGRKALGTLNQEDEVSKREQELGEAKSALAVLRAKARPDEIEAARTHIGSLEQEAQYLEKVRSELRIATPVAGVVSTPRLNQAIGQHFKEGDLICEVEDPLFLEAEIVLPEQDTAGLEPGLPVTLVARALPLERFETNVERISPRVVAGQAQGTLCVYCKLPQSMRDLRPGMSGFARISNGRRSAGMVLFGRLLRSLRSEFWW
jgi:multidrug resistance efflux pump